MPTGREHFALDWIKSELLETLSQAREALEAYAESDRDQTRMRVCLTSMHQVHGTLVMLELEGLALLADHLERLAQALLNEAIADEAGAGQCLMQGILELPGYLEEVQQGGADGTEPMLPLVNEARRHLGESPLAGAAVTDLAGTADSAAVERFEGIDGVDKAKKIRSAYQQVLLSILKGGDRTRAVGTLSKVAQGLCRVCQGTPHENQWRAFGEFVGSLAASDGPLDGDAVKLLRRVDSEIRQLASDGVEALQRPVATELVRQLIESCRQRNYTSEVVEELRASLQSTGQSDGLAISGRQALASAAAALREELALVKDRLDLFVRANAPAADELTELIAPLKQIGSTLSLLGFESSKTIVADQVEALAAAADTDGLDAPDVMVVASALVQVDENLASFTQGKAEVEQITDDAQRTVTVEARAGLEQVKQAIVDYISSQWDPRHLDGVGERIRAIRGALDMIPLRRASELLGACSAYVGEVLVPGEPPEWAAMDALADAISGVDYYLERLAEETSVGAEDILELVQRSLDSLGYGDWQPATEAAQPAAEPVELTSGAVLEEAAEPADALVAEDEAEAQPAVDEGFIVEDATPAAAGPVAGDPNVASLIVQDPFEDAADSVPPAADEEGSDTVPAAGSAAAEVAGSDVEDAPAATALHGDREITEVGEAPESEEPQLEMDDDDSFDLSNELFDDLAAEHDLPAAQELADDQPDHEEHESEAAEQAEALEAAASEVADVDPAADDGVIDLTEFLDDGLTELDDVEDATADAAAETDAPIGADASPLGSASEAAPLPEHIAAKTATLVDVFESDEEIVEIFVEEVGEVLETIGQWLPQWADDFANEEALTEVRRAFHTLKGSGRIVGANVIGEAAWSVENMLNRVIEGTVAATAQFVAVIDEARGLVLDLRAAFEAEQAPDLDQVGRLMERADILASGGTLEEAAQATEPPPIDVDAISAPATEDALGEPPTALFVAEARAHLEAIRAACQGDAFVIDADVLRAMHTLAGSSGMAGVDTIAELARPVYELARAAHGDGQRTDVGAELAAFFNAALQAFDDGIDALQADAAPIEHAQLIADADLLLMRATQAQAPTAAGLMNLPALGTVLESEEFLENWRAGVMDLEFSGKLTAALAELAEVADAEQRTALADLSRAQARAVEYLENDALDSHGFAVLSEANEAILQQVDAIASDASAGDVSGEVAALKLLLGQRPDSQDARLEELVDASASEVSDFHAAAAAGDELREPSAAEPIEADAPDNVIGFPVPADPEPPALAEQLDDPMLEPATAATEEPAEQVAAPLADTTGDASETPAAGELLPDDIDEEIIGVFFEEAEEILEALDQNIHDWSDEPENRLYLENLLRGLHTLKGGARLSGLTRLGDLTHQLESFLIEIQGEAATPGADFFSDLGVRYDELATLVAQIREAVEAGEPLPAAPAIQTPEPASDAATLVAEGEPEDQRPEETMPAPADAEASEFQAELSAEAAEPPVELTPDDQLAESATEPAAESEPEPAAAGPLAAPAEPEQAAVEPEAAGKADRGKEMVRVGAGLLEQLVNLAGESSIVRARVEQGMTDFTNALDEMETTIERVREQLRRLEIETEAQILFRHDNVDAPSYDEFDPLEMDRYSQLQQLSRGLSESASDMLDLKDTLLFKARESETLLLQQARINTELQEGLMRTRMVPFSRLLPRLRRIVRQVSRELGKEVDFKAYNVEGELDRNLLERMVPPLEHMLRNAVDHGIESAQLRKSYGKPATGRIDLRLSREGGDVVIEISDDGAGIDVESVRAKAVERGLIAEGAALHDEEVSQFVLAPGFSTAKSVTQISGRGVGMDVVHSEVKQLGGSINILSRAGKGTRFTVRVPFTVSVNRALMVSVGEDLYAIPLNNIEGIVLLSPQELETLYAPNGNTFEYAGIPYRVRYLGHYLGREFRAGTTPGSVPVVLVRSGDQCVAVHVDAVQGSREIVVKSLGPQFAGVGGVSGATILGDGSVVVILDLLALIRAQSGEGAAVTRRTLAGASKTSCVMVVDDSVTVRKVTSRLLERQGMDVIVAKDGIEAVSLLQERRPDVMLLDIEMPRMDGFEVARQVRHDERLKDLPIVMISSRTGSKHQEHATELGVNRFLGKPFQESELLGTIEELVN